MVDLDVQASAYKWSTYAEDNARKHPARVDRLHGLSLKSFVLEIHARQEGFDFVIIDTPPQVSSKDLGMALLVADLGVVPLTPNVAHRDALEELYPLIDAAQELRESRGLDKLPIHFLLNRFDLRRSGHKNIVDGLLKGELAFSAINEQGVETRYPILRSGLTDRAAYEEAWNLRTRLQFTAKPNSKPRLEMRALTTEILELLA